MNLSARYANALYKEVGQFFKKGKEMVKSDLQHVIEDILKDDFPVDVYNNEIFSKKCQGYDNTISEIRTYCHYMPRVGTKTIKRIERYFDDDKKFHHIVDPRTGYSATELISVTIITGKAVDADAIATAVFVLGPDEGLEFIEKFTDVEGLLITKEKEIIKSSGFDY